MRHLAFAAALAAIGMSGLAAGAAQAGDAAAGKKMFSRCKACHMIADGDEVIVRGGRTGPNLFGVIGRQAGTEEGFRYGPSIVEAGEDGLVWTQEKIAEYVKNPKAFLVEVTGDSGARSMMSFKLRKGGEDVAAYLAEVSG